MAGKLYKQQGRNISVQPVDATYTRPTLSPITDVLIKNAARIAQENYAMGNAIALHESLEYAYNQAKDSPEQFDKLANSAIKTYADDLPSNVRDNLMGKFILKKQEYASKVETNYYNKIDKEHTDNIHKTTELTTNDMLGQVDNLYKSVINKDDKNAEIALASYKNSQDKMKLLSEQKNLKGEYIYNKQERESAQNTQTGHLDAFKRNIDALSKDELKDFDKTLFQDKLLFQQKTGADDKTYAQMNEYVKNRRTALGDEEKRVIANQASFTAARLLSTRDPEQYDELKKSGVFPKEVFDAMDKVYKTAPSQKKVENAFVLEKSFMHLYNTVGSFDPRFDDTKNIQDAIVRFGTTWQKFSDDNGLDQQQQQEVLDMATRYMSDKVFRDSAKNLFADTAIGSRVQTVGLGLDASNLPDKAKVPDFMKRNDFSLKGNTLTKYGDKERAERYALETAHQYMKLYATQTMLGNYDEANNLLQEGNRAVIIAANSDKIPEKEFYRMEKDLANGKPAYYTMEDGRTIQFMGYSNKDAVFKIKM